MKETGPTASDSISVKYRTGKSTETESRSGLSGAGEEGIGVTVYGARVSCRGEEKDLQLIIEMVAQYCAYTYYLLNYTLKDGKTVLFMLCVFCHTHTE